jgi:hypothetical protein
MSTSLVPTGNIFTADGFATTQKIAETLVKSGILPRGIDTPAKAFAVIVKGWEIGVGPMRALTGIHLIEGKPSVSPELKLERFRERGGRVKWLRSDGTVAECMFTAPNGDTHTETVTMEEMRAAGVASKDNWRKYPKSMLRARCVAFGLRALGEGDGSHTPDELGAETNEAGEVEYTPPAKEEAKAAAPKATTATTTPVIPAAGPGDGDIRPTAPAAEPRNASQVPHTGGPIGPEQIKTIHALKAKVGGLTDEAYRKGIAVYRRADGSRCVDENGVGSSKYLSRDQADHLIKRFEAKIAKQTQRVAPENDTAPSDIDDVISRPPQPKVTDPPKPSLEDLLQSEFEEDEKEAHWLHAHFGVEHRKELTHDQAATALHLLIAMQMGPDEFDRVLTVARSTGRIR